ncbi:S8 family serine peptidase [Desmospora activa]|uniref:Subtilisin family serine protease n=1 Tax=Desmospora activa DSM 45169 TaxID=1121389 RepID=A0A2T4ZDF7_9BACL|nr:S8 family serine peptidase [Desmospora activa]PTM59920.1 subtilisin family serine protease [Desmospora activa DSM 45169]
MTDRLKRALVFLVALALAVSPGVFTMDARAAAGLDTTKLDSAFSTQLKQDKGKYYDVIVVFKQKKDVKQLDSFNRDYKTFRVLPMARMLLNKQEIEEVTRWDHVRFVEPNRKLQLFNAEGREMTRSEQVQQELGYDGSDIEVAVIDTGADGLHPDLSNLKYNWQVFGTLGLAGDSYISSTPDGIDLETPLLDAHAKTGVSINTDEYGHGTHVIGTVAGTGEASDGRYRGMAPKATIHSYSSSAGIFLIFTLESYDHILYQNQQGKADIRIINNSWGSSGCEFNPFNTTNVATRMAYEQGILSVFAYGNDGPDPDTCNPYTTAPYVLSVAATEKDYKLAGFSSRGLAEQNHDREAALNNLDAFLDASEEEQASWDYEQKPLGIYRPGVAAPGSGIVSAQNPLHPMTTSGSLYGAASGTSMASPHVAGVMTLVADAYKKTHGKHIQPLDLVRLAEVTANKEVMFGYQAFEAGAGFVDAYASVQSAVANDIPTAVTDDDLVSYEPPTNVKVKTQPYSGTVLANSWQTGIGYEVHGIQVKEGALRIYAEVEWANELENVYISLYAPGLDVETDEPTVSSAGLLDTGNKRYVEYPFPEAGEWQVRIDGRTNTITDYTGKFEIHTAEEE